MSINTRYTDLVGRIDTIQVDNANRRERLPKREIELIIMKVLQTGRQFDHPMMSKNYRRIVKTAEDVILEVARVDTGYAKSLADQLYPFRDRRDLERHGGIRFPSGGVSEEEMQELLDELPAPAYE